MAVAARTRSTTEYGELKRIVKEAGLLEAQPAYYTLKTTTALGMLVIGVAVALFAHNPFVIIADAVFMGFVSTQLGLLAHDIAHWQAFRGRRMNHVANLLFGNLLLGVSHSWWTTKHNQHHATPNHLDEDPDVNFPMLVFAAEQIATKARWLRPVIALQAYVFVFLLPFQSLNARYHSIRHLRSPKANMPWLQGAFIFMHLALYALLLWQLGLGMGIAFFCVHQAVFGLYNSSVFASNHKGMEMISKDSRLGFLREQVVTSRNVRSHPITDFWAGGLNFQIEHHLFPSMPRNRLKDAQVLVREFCHEHGISYYETGLFRSYGEILSALNRASASLRGGGMRTASAATD